MSEHTKGEVEYSIVTSNEIDIVSKEDESVVIAHIISEEDELGTLEPENARRIKLCWNSHDSLAKQRDDLLAACKGFMKFAHKDLPKGFRPPEKWFDGLKAATHLIEAAIASVQKSEVIR